ncbi:serine hydrolase [Streptomyces sp. BP-8]|uniref:Serine hydrolase n=1 Tax=Streptomyces sirii TaxID=3127701 RepID=A0ABZ2QWZ0_9ACTN
MADRSLSRVVCTSAKAGLADRLTKDIRAAVADTGAKSHTSVALYDRTTGTQCTYDADRQYDSASVVKTIVLGTLLRQAQDENRELTSTQRALATKMITKSDNDATTALWKQLGLGRIKAFLRLAGMKHTAPDEKGYWGLTQVNATDQLTLMKLFTSNNAVLNKHSRAIALDLMSRVISSQRWGVSAGAPSGATVHLKNGWLQRTSSGWRVHSVGAFTGEGHDYGLAVLTADHGSMPTSVKAIESIARKVHADLNGGSTHSHSVARSQNVPTTSDGSLVPVHGQ